MPLGSTLDMDLLDEDKTLREIDDDELYEVLGDNIKCDRRVGDKVDMLINCARFIERRCEAGGWPTYAQLEQEIIKLKEDNEKLRCLNNYWFKEAAGELY